MPQEKSARNKTIELSEVETRDFSERLLTLEQAATLEDVLDKTINQDTLAVLDYLPSDFVDLLFVDPPYNMNKVFRSETFKQMDSAKYEEWVDSWMSKIVRLLKPTASVYVCGDWQSSAALFNVLSKYFEVRNRITWEREKGRGAKSNWKNSSEDIWFATVSQDYYFNVDAVKLKKKVIAPYRDATGNPKDWRDEGNGNFRLTHPSNLWTDLTVPFWSMPENTNHPTQKPEKLLAKVILASSKEGDVIFDPFLGSGTTSVVAKKLSRHYVGIEIDAYYACLAEKRLQMAANDKRIQGFSDGFFWERNIKPNDTKPSELNIKQRKLL